jgi:hypothetical protein
MIVKQHFIQYPHISIFIFLILISSCTQNSNTGNSHNSGGLETTNTGKEFVVKDEQVLRIPKPESASDARQSYPLGLLHLVLAKTADEYGPYAITHSEKRMLQGRALALLQAGEEIDLFWSMTSSQREEDLLPIRVPIMKGLLGHRIFLIRNVDKKRFSAINTLEELNAYTAGQGHDWPDTAILRSNGINVVDATEYESLFIMLQNKRFDYFPRGVNEAFAEASSRSDMDISVEMHLMLVYPAPQYYFVNKNNTKLAERIERGLLLMIEDGTFDKYFYNHPSITLILEKAELKNRKVFYLDNPLLKQNPFVNDKFKFDIDRNK